MSPLKRPVTMFASDVACVNSHSRSKEVENGQSFEFAVRTPQKLTKHKIIFAGGLLALIDATFKLHNIKTLHVFPSDFSTRYLILEELEG